MNEFEKQIGSRILAVGDFDSGRAEAARREVVDMYSKRLRNAMIIAWVGIGIAVVMEAVGVAGLGATLAMGGRIELMILFAVLTLSGGQFHVLIKLWYWIMNCRYKVQEDVKQLRLEVARISVNRQAEAD